MSGLTWLMSGNSPRMATKIRSGFCTKIPCTAPQVQPFSSGNNSANGLGQFGSTLYGPSTNSSLGFAGSTHCPVSFWSAAHLLGCARKSPNVRTPIAAQTIAPTTILRPTIFMGVPPLFAFRCSPQFAKLAKTGTRPGAPISRLALHKSSAAAERLAIRNFNFDFPPRR